MLAVLPGQRPQLIGLDLDGTVVDSDNRIPDETLAELRACHAAGIALAFLTGRRPRTGGKHLDAIGVPAFAATNSGCLLWRYPQWTPLARRIFPAELVQPVAEFVAPHSANFYVDSLRHGFEFFYLEREPSPLLEDYITRWGFCARRIDDPAEMAGYEITQVALPTDDAETYRLRDGIRARFDGQLLALAVRWPLMPCLALELFHPDANKGSALRFFAEQLGAPPARVVAVGDDVNDQAMIEWAGHGVAMPGSGPELTAAADEVLVGAGPPALAPFLRQLRELPE